MRHGEYSTSFVAIASLSESVKQQMIRIGVPDRIITGLGDPKIAGADVNAIAHDAIRFLKIT